MDNKRQVKRYRTRAYCGVFDRMSNKSLGCLVDLSIDGFQVMTSEEFFNGKTYKLRIEMHKVIEGSRDINIDAECMWRKESIEPSLYIAGFKYSDIEQDIQRRIKLFTNSSVFRYPQTQEINIDS